MTRQKKRKIIELAVLLLLVAASLIYLFGGARIKNASDAVTKGDEGTRSLVVYFSRLGETAGNTDAVSSATVNSNREMDGSDTEAAAKMIQSLTGADLYQIHTKRYYRDSFSGTAATAWIEEMLHLRPKLAAQPKDLDNYDVIYVGYPIWWFNAPMAIGSFLESYDLTGKTIVPFCTSADNGIDVSMDYIRKVARNANVLDGYRVHNADRKELSDWLSRIGVLQQEEKKNSEVDIIGQEGSDAEIYRGFQVDQVFCSEKEGDIHYSIYIPDTYDGSKPYALYVTLPGYEGLYFQGVAANLKSEAFGFEAQKYNDKMIIVAPQLNDWGETSADQTIALVKYILEQYNIDSEKVYANGYSGGGETMSLVLGKAPELFTAYLQVSSQWDGTYEPVAEQRIPIYFVIGRDDEYYGSEPTKKAYDTLHRLYEEQGLTDEEINSLLVLDIKDEDYFSERKAPNEHGGGGLVAYDDEIMGWLFSH